MSGRAWWWLALALALWAPVWLGWAEWWSGRPEQAHGWLVPGFALWLGRERWLDAPESGVGSGWWAAALAGALGLWTAGLVLLTPNAYWPTAQWLAGLGAAGGWLAAAAGAGGRRWAGHFAGAALFPLCAAAWPTMVQAPVLELFSPLLAGGAAEVVNAGGRLAMAQGAVIEVADGWVGVDEACAGLRSLDAAVMMAWFIGEQRRLAWRARLGLAVAALAVAVGGNFFRATTLVWVAAGAGPRATEAWHDPLGWAVLGLTLAGVLGAAEWMERKSAPVPAGRGAGAPAGRGFAVAGLALAAAGWAAGAAWYSPNEYGPGRVGWELAPAGPEWRKAPAPEGLDTVLAATRWQGLAGEGEGWRGLAYVIAWEGDVAAAENVFTHGPELCLPGIGLSRQAETGEVTVEAAGRRLTLAGSRYADAAGRAQHVWFARWDEAEGRVVGRGVSEASPVETRLAGVKARRRGASLAQVVLVAAGPGDDAAAARWAEEWAPRLLKRRE